MGQRPVEKPVDGMEEIPEIQLPSTEGTSAREDGQLHRGRALGPGVDAGSEGRPGRQAAQSAGRRRQHAGQTHARFPRRQRLPGQLGASDLSSIAPLVTQLQSLLLPPSGLILDAPVGAQEPLPGHTFELLDQLGETDPIEAGYDINIRSPPRSGGSAAAQGRRGRQRFRSSRSTPFRRRRRARRSPRFARSSPSSRGRAACSCSSTSHSASSTTAARSRSRRTSPTPPTVRPSPTRRSAAAMPRWPIRRSS